MNIDPAMQARIEADFCPVDLSVAGPGHAFAVCQKHKTEKCDQCELDFTALNRVSKIFITNPALRCPPPPNVLQQELSDMVKTRKDEGNVWGVFFIYITFSYTQKYHKAGKYMKALIEYNSAANVAVQRPPWEGSARLREELSTLLSNRSAALFELEDFLGSLVDSETVVSIRCDWAKGHFRKAKALVALGQLEEARDSVSLGLQFEPNNSVRSLMVWVVCC